jgi:hypothetical protein
VGKWDDDVRLFIFWGLYAFQGCDPVTGSPDGLARGMSRDRYEAARIGMRLPGSRPLPLLHPALQP